MQDKKWSALFYAYEGGHHGTVKLLIEYGADETLKDKVSEFVVVVVVIYVQEGKEAAAYKQDHEEIENKVAPSIRNLMKKQLKKLSTIPSSLMKKLRAKKKKLDMVRSHEVATLFNVVIVFSVHIQDLLHHCKNGNFEAAKELLEGGGVDIETKDFNFRVCEYCKTTDQQSWQYGNHQILNIFQDWTPLMWACENGHFKIVELLIQHYANVMGRAEVLQLILDYYQSLQVINPLHAEWLDSLTHSMFQQLCEDSQPTAETWSRLQCSHQP